MIRKIMIFLAQQSGGIVLTVIVALLAFLYVPVYERLTDAGHWLLWKNFLFGIAGLFSEKYSAFINIIIFGLIARSVYCIRRKHRRNWIKDIEYSISDHCNSAITSFIAAAKNIDDKHSYDNFCRDVTQEIYTIFHQLSHNPHITWLTPDGTRLPVFMHSDNIKDIIADYNCFKTGEGVVGHAWCEGKADYYAANYHNPRYTVRKGCDNYAYMCCPVGGEASPFGIIGVGFMENRDIDPIEVKTLELICQSVYLIIRNLNDNITAGNARST